MGELRDMNENARNAEDSAQNGLTCIPQAIHCPARSNESEAEYDELDSIAVEVFLDTIARIALSISARDLSEEDNPERDN